ncbi:MAG TPA: helix-hairpin-helix domain-containing protein [Acidobacteriaceae bacterium]|nr:helix-hairpin-helix domain-containing protein [Acidobacteriaceae bacterium]
MKSTVFANIGLVGLLGLLGCTPQSPSPDQIRQNTANATATAARDAKAMAQGVFDGLKKKGPMNINRASAADLETLPGIDHAAADRIIAGRPYKNSIELERRKIISKAEYNKIANQIEAQ